MNQKFIKLLKPRHVLVILLLLLIAGAVFTFIFLSNRKSALTQQPQNTQPLRPESTEYIPESVEGQYLFNGTIFWARAVEQQAQGDYKQPFSMLDTFNRNKYDAWLAGLECPITNNTVPYQTQIRDLIFNCRPEFLPEAVKYFNIFNLANNHTNNQDGEIGLNDTRTRLEAAGVQYFGTFDSSDSQNVCEVLALPVRIQKSDKSELKADLPVAFCGWHYFYHKPGAGEIAFMEQYSKVMPVFAFAEMGPEYQAKADATQLEIAHQIIDSGPEFLFANNPHWVQNTEVYNGKLIVYSLGNFIFDQLDSETNRSASIDLKVTVPYDDNLAKWLALDCKTFHDDCLLKAQQQGLTKVKLKLEYDVIAGQNGYKVITHKADAATQKAVEQRTNWPQTLIELGQHTR